MMAVRTKAAIVLASQALSAAVAYGSLILIGRLFLPLSFGSYAYAFGLTSLFVLLSDLGLNYVHQRNVAMGLPIGPSLGVFMRLRLAFLAALLLLALLAWVVLPAIVVSILRTTTPLVLAWLMILQVMVILRAFLEGTWQAQQLVHRVEGLRLLESGLTLAFLANAGLLLAAVNGWRPPLAQVGMAWAEALHLVGPFTVEQGALLIAGSYTAAKLVCLLVALVWWLGDGWVRLPWDKALARDFIKLSIPLSVTALLSLVITSFDIVALGITWDAEEVAYFGIAQRLGMVGLLIGISIASVLFPRYAQLHALGDKAGLDHTFHMAQRYLVLIAAPIAAAMLALPAQGLNVTVGPNYGASVAPLRWLAAWAFVMTLATPLQSRVMAEGRARTLLIVAAIGAGVVVVLNLVLVPHALLGFGAAGAAAATFVAGLACYAYLRHWSYQTHGTALWGVHLWRVLVAAGLTGALWWAAGRVVPHLLQYAWQLLVIGLAGLILYVLLLALLREVGRDDWQMVSRIMNRHGR